MRNQAGSHKNPITLDDDDDFVTDSSTNSSPYFTQPTQINPRPTLGASKNARSQTSTLRTTQPTQILDHSTLKKATPYGNSSGHSMECSSLKKVPTQKRTQPTQITDRPTVGLKSRTSSVSDELSSSPAKVEVPRSSPPRSSPPRPRASRPGIFSLAPAGTQFRLPEPKVMTKPASVDTHSNRNEKRKHPEGSSDELGRHPKLARSGSTSSSDVSRGDIQRTSFQRHVWQPNSSQPMRDISKIESELATFEKDYDAKTQRAAKILRLKLERKFSVLQCAKTIKAQRGDIEAARKALLGEDSRPSLASPSAPRQFKRLMRGRNPKNASPVKPATAPLISLVDSDSDEELGSDTKGDGDDYQADSESEAETEGDTDGETENRTAKKMIEALPVQVGAKRASKILEYLDACTIESLAADAKISKDDAKYFITKRPFRHMNQVKAVHQFKVVRKKREKVNLGEDVFDALNHHIKRLTAIDRVVQQCEIQGSIINAKIANWKMDQLGNIKGNAPTSASNAVTFPKEPRSLHGTMYSYQIYGMNWIWQLYSRGFGGILADDMGLGKTCQVIAFLALLHDNLKNGLVQDTPGPNLVVVPVSVLENWQKEFAHFAPGLSIIKYSGSPDKRDEIAYQIRESSKEYHVILTSYSQLSRTRDVVSMNKIGINAAIFDEGHKLKNAKTAEYPRLMKIEAEWKLIITGTPIQNNIMEMITLLNFISPKLFKRDREYFEELFTQKASLQQVSEGATLLSDRVQRARSILQPFILQRKKEQVLFNLPAKTRRVVYCDMFGEQQKAYDEKLARFGKEDLQKSLGGRKSDDNNPWMQLRKATTHPQLFRRFFNDKTCEEMAKTALKYIPRERQPQTELRLLNKEFQEKYSDFQLHLWCRDEPCLKKYDCPQDAWYESGKVKKLLELLDEFKKNGDRVLVFSPYVKTLEILEECLGEQGINYRVLYGDTQQANRQALVDEFQEDTSIDVFLLTTQAGGQGINLTSANKIVIFEQSGNPQHDMQAENRAHRLGQTRDVEVIRLITQGTVDSLIHKACQKKLELAGRITGFNEDLSDDVEKDIREEVIAQLRAEDAAPCTPTTGLVTPPKSEQ